MGPLGESLPEVEPFPGLGLGSRWRIICCLKRGIIGRGRGRPPRPRGSWRFVDGMGPFDQTGGELHFREDLECSFGDQFVQHWGV